MFGLFENVSATTLTQCGRMITRPKCAWALSLDRARVSRNIAVTHRDAKSSLSDVDWGGDWLAVPLRREEGTACTAERRSRCRFLSGQVQPHALGCVCDQAFVCSEPADTTPDSCLADKTHTVDLGVNGTVADVKTAVAARQGMLKCYAGQGFACFRSTVTSVDLRAPMQEFLVMSRGSCLLDVSWRMTPAWPLLA